MTEFITRDNVLALVEMMGKEMAELASPNHYSFEYRDRAKRYELAVALIRRAYAGLKRGDDALQVLEWLDREAKVPVTCLGLVIEGLKGKLERNEDWVRKLPSGHHWITFEGDFYSVGAGDRLNRPVVRRMANSYKDEVGRVLEGSSKIAAIIPNPCTRIKIDAQAC